MFELVELKDALRIAPQRFEDEEGAVRDEINKKYANKVLYGIGLVLGLYDLLSVSDGVIHPGDGGSHVKVSFRLVVFKPFVGEVLSGSITNSDSDGIWVSMSFFEDVHIPPSCLPSPSQFDESEKCWRWVWNDNDMWLDIGQEIQFRVFAVEYGARDAHSKPPTRLNTDQLVAADEKPSASQPPMTITGYINEPGLGLLCWWR